MRSGMSAFMTKEEAAKFLGRLGGLRGGKARMAMLSDEEKSELGKKAAKARWERYRARESQTEGTGK